MNAPGSAPAPEADRPPRVLYRLGQFVSHRRAGEDNMAALAAAGVELTDDPARADLAVIHDEPPFFPNHLGAIGSLPFVGYCVWEMDRLPDTFAVPLTAAAEVWTCSAFSARAFAARLPRVAVVPHVVRRPRVRPEDLARMRARLNLPADPADDREYRFYAVADALNPRKNLPALLAAFGRVRELWPHVRLVVKQYRAPWPELGRLPGVTSLEEDLTQGEMGALHALCHCLVSPHRAEAWGLSLSQAMAFGRTVVATGYSGNLEYMDETSALLVRHRLVEVGEADLARSSLWFDARMRWAEPDPGHLTECMLRAAQGRVPEGLAERARAGVARFGPRAVGECMLARIRAVLEGVRSGRIPPHGERKGS